MRAPERCRSIEIAVQFSRTPTRPGTARERIPTQPGSNEMFSQLSGQRGLSRTERTADHHQER